MESSAQPIHRLGVKANAIADARDTAGENADFVIIFDARETALLDH